MDSQNLRRLSTVHLAIVAIGAVVFALSNGLGVPDRPGVLGAIFFDALYSFNLLAIITAVILVSLCYTIVSDETLLLAALASFSWFLGSFFWFSYAYLLDELLSYPSVIQVAFNGFHLLMIPLLLYVLRESDVDLWRPASGIVALAISIPWLLHVFVSLPMNVVVYNTVYFFIVSTVLVLALHLLWSDTLRLLGGALVLFSAADFIFVTTTLFDQQPLVFALDPLWFSAHALIAYALVGYGLDGELP